MPKLILVAKREFSLGSPRFKPIPC